MPLKSTANDTTSGTVNALLSSPTHAETHQTVVSGHADSYSPSAVVTSAGIAPQLSIPKRLNFLRHDLMRRLKSKLSRKTAQVVSPELAQGEEQTMSLAPLGTNHNGTVFQYLLPPSSGSELSIPAPLSSVPRGHMSSALVPAGQLGASVAANNEPMVAIPHRIYHGDRVVTTYEYISQKEMLRRYPIVCYSDKNQPDNAIPKRLRRYFQPQAKEFSSVLRQTYNSNILLLPEDPELRKPTILALQKELGHRIPVVDFKRLYCDDRDREKLFFPDFINNFYDALRKQAGVAPNKPLVLYLKNTSTNTLLQLASEAGSKSIFRDKNLRLIVDSTPKALKPYYPHPEEDDDDTRLKLHRFKEFTLRSLSPSAWSSLLKNAHETNRLQRKYRCSLSEPQLRQLLQVVLRKNKGQLTQNEVLSSLDSLGAFIRLKYPKDPPTYVRPITDIDLIKDFFKKESLLAPSSGPVKIKFSFELEQGLDDLIGLEGPKNVVQIFADQFNKADLASDTQKKNGQAKTMLLHGPPGLGKTMLGEGAAKAVEELTKQPVTLVSVNGGSFSTGKHFKEGLEAVDTFFDSIENADTPIVVAFIDELDGMYNRKDMDLANGAVATDMNATTNHFLTRLQQLKSNPKKHILLISATNFYSKVDKASLDRMDYEFLLSHSDAEHKKKLLELEFKNYSLPYNEALLKKMVKKIESDEYQVSERKLSSVVLQLYDLAFQKRSKKIEQNTGMNLNNSPLPPLEVTDEMITEVLKRFQSAQQASKMSAQEVWDQGIR